MCGEKSVGGTRIDRARGWHQRLGECLVEGERCLGHAHLLSEPSSQRNLTPDGIEHSASNAVIGEATKRDTSRAIEALCSLDETRPGCAFEVFANVTGYPELAHHLLAHELHQIEVRGRKLIGRVRGRGHASEVLAENRVRRQ